MRDYSARELGAPDSGLRLKYVFCDAPHVAVVRGATPRRGQRRTSGVDDAEELIHDHDDHDDVDNRVVEEGVGPAPEVVPERAFQAAMSRNRFVRFEKGVAAFVVYPTRQRDLVVNRMLWDAVHESVYDAKRGNALFGKNIFCLGFPDGLYRFLQALSWDKLQTYIVHLLCIHYSLHSRENDAEAMRRMREELVPEVWRKVEARLRDAGEARVEGNKSSYELVLEGLDSLFLLPWRISVYASYWTSDDMDSAMDEGDRVVPQASHRDDHGPPTGTNWSSTHWSLYKDWCTYSDLLCKKLRLPSGDALFRMDSLITAGRQRDVFDSIHTLLLCARRDESALSSIPEDVLRARLAPLLVALETPGRDTHSMA